MNYFFSLLLLLLPFICLLNSSHFTTQEKLFFLFHLTKKPKQTNGLINVYLSTYPFQNRLTRYIIFVYHNLLLI